ncbi:hypothetical protein L2E82_34238 [Cichorium intybus]|uniref:Uncharacterized protein n=1 Tax=Cichorium intybus TaxID=13427 RepID=A0ACB9BLT6_CICIN|nr:hypothetical protein L2E82_34238 [Cichorium intybus]
MYWEEFHKKCYWDVAIHDSVEAAWEKKAKERYATHEQIAIDLEKQLGEPPSLYDLFMYTHTKNHDGKTFLNDKAKHVHEFFATCPQQTLNGGDSNLVMVAAVLVVASNDIVLMLLAARLFCWRWRNLEVNISTLQRVIKHGRDDEAIESEPSVSLSEVAAHLEKILNTRQSALPAHEYHGDQGKRDQKL